MNDTPKTWTALATLPTWEGIAAATNYHFRAAKHIKLESASLGVWHLVNIRGFILPNIRVRFESRDNTYILERTNP